MPVDPVSNRHGMTVEQFAGLSPQDQQRVIEAKLKDKMVRPHLNKAINRIRKTAKKMNDAFNLVEGNK